MRCRAIVAPRGRQGPSLSQGERVEGGCDGETCSAFMQVSACFNDPEGPNTVATDFRSASERKSRGFQ
jgi:hypothetical protein